MRKIEISGFLGSEPEMKSTQQGTQFYTFRMASHEWGDKDNETFWYTVNVFNSALWGICKTLKRGSSVVVEGHYRDRIYKTKKSLRLEDGSEEPVFDISRDITAFFIDFLNTGKKNDGSTGSEPRNSGADTDARPKPVNSEPTVEEILKNAPKPTTETKGEQTPAPAPTTAVDDDDLPF